MSDLVSAIDTISKLPPLSADAQRTLAAWRLTWGDLFEMDEEEPIPDLLYVRSDLYPHAPPYGRHDPLSLTTEATASAAPPRLDLRYVRYDPRSIGAEAIDRARALRERLEREGDGFEKWEWMWRERW